MKDIKKVNISVSKWEDYECYFPFWSWAVYCSFCFCNWENKLAKRQQQTEAVEYFLCHSKALRFKIIRNLKENVRLKRTARLWEQAVQDIGKFRKGQDLWSQTGLGTFLQQIAWSPRASVISSAKSGKQSQRFKFVFETSFWKNTYYIICQIYVTLFHLINLRL